MSLFFFFIFQCFILKNRWEETFSFPSYITASTLNSNFTKNFKKITKDSGFANEYKHKHRESDESQSDDRRKKKKDSADKGFPVTDNEWILLKRALHASRGRRRFNESWRNATTTWISGRVTLARERRDAGSQISRLLDGPWWSPDRGSRNLVTARVRAVTKRDEMAPWRRETYVNLRFPFTCPFVSSRQYRLHRSGDNFEQLAEVRTRIR